MKDEIANVWRMPKVIVIPVVIGALGAVSVNFKEYMKKIGMNAHLGQNKSLPLLYLGHAQLIIIIMVNFILKG